MDRYDELDAKRRGSEGLSDDEANELGRLEAERRGAEYSNASRPPPEVLAERDTEEPEAATAEQREAEEHEDIDATVWSREREKGAQVDNPPVA